MYFSNEEKITQFQNQKSNLDIKNILLKDLVLVYTFGCKLYTVAQQGEGRSALGVSVLGMVREQVKYEKANNLRRVKISVGKERNLLCCHVLSPRFLIFKFRYIQTKIIKQHVYF